MKPKPLLIAGILTLLGIVGFPHATRWVQSLAAQKQALDQTPRLLAEVGDVSKNNNLDNLKAQQQRLQSNIQLLEAIPNLPLMGYPQAQEQLKQLRPLAEKLNQRISEESDISKNLQKAVDLDNQALEIANNPPHPEERLKNAADKWGQAIRLLEKIPAQSPNYAQAQQGLKALRPKKAQVDQWLVREKQSVRKMETVLTTAKTVANNTKDKFPLEMADLLNAATQWSRIVLLLREIPGNTTVSEDASKFLPIAQRNLQSAKSAIANLKNCKAAQAELPGICSDEVALLVEDFPVDAFTAEEDISIASADIPVVPAVTTASNISSSPVVQRYRESRLRRYPKAPPPVMTSSAGGGSVEVKGHTRSDGTFVRSHTRSSPSRSSGFGWSRSSGGG
ncbi:hypothetical protein [Alkalinema sp. FACHB-956]|uniref:hypothetical protein n=1 Tax=Alkalinema sp. FACHB-956 TaxID=2692768 RepID=UPI0016826C17|nr:hypothetical protein [Alkalinema sp. FACHB-956]MBD2329654.1 hypothetical protein [Alkalinema sp. FACHB-956]